MSQFRSNAKQACDKTPVGSPGTRKSYAGKYRELTLLRQRGAGGASHPLTHLLWGYQLDLRNQLFLTNDYLKDSLYVGIRRIIIELLDNDGFSVKKYNQSFDNETLGLIKQSYPLKTTEAKRVKVCKMYVECSIKDRY